MLMTYLKTKYFPQNVNRESSHCASTLVSEYSLVFMITFKNLDLISLFSLKVRVSIKISTPINMRKKSVSTIFSIFSSNF